MEPKPAPLNWYTPPYVATVLNTPEEADWLPVEAIVRQDDGKPAHKFWQSRHPRKDGRPLSEWEDLTDDGFDTELLCFPVTVLWPIGWKAGE